MDLSQVLLLLLAVATIVLAGLVGSSFERKKASVRKKAVTGSRPVTVAIRTQLAQEQVQIENASLDITWKHALGFLGFGSAVLLLLYYVNAVMVLIVLYSFGATSATSQFLICPLLHYVSLLGRKNKSTSSSSAWLQKRVCAVSNDWVGDIDVTAADVVSTFIAIGYMRVDIYIYIYIYI